MALTDKLKPINDTHSIKEAVISVFLANPIIKPERFRALIENDFKDMFQQFETVAQVQIQVKNEKGIIHNIPPKFSENIGFRFLAFNKGKQQKVLQAINETKRNFVSYHSLDYLSWQSFYTDYINCISSLTKHQSDLFATAFSLHYIDEFLWEDNGPIDINAIFNKDSNYIPKEFFSSVNTNYNLVTERNIDQTTKYFDRLEIKIEPNIRPSVIISHNVTRPLNDVLELKNLVDEPRFKDILQLAHDHNKDLLKNVLTEDVARMIHLIKN